MSAMSQPPVKDLGKTRRWRRFAWSLILGCALTFSCYLFRAPLLTRLAEAWVVNEPVAKADAIVVLGGGVENRPFAAARLFHDGVAPKILYMDVQLGSAEELGVTLSEKELTRRIMLSNNVPESALLAIGTNVASTYDESQAVRAWVKQTGATSIIITTELFHTRRALWIFHRELEDVPVKIYISAVDPVRYKIKNWWQNEEGLIQFQNEVIKSVYYWFKY